MTRPNTPLCAAERDFIRHALGLTRQKVGYRNHYAAGGDDVAIGRALVARGFAVELSASRIRPEVRFAITHAGFEAAKKPGESMDAEELAAMRAREMA